MTVTQLLFGFSGRLKRLPWWIATILADLGLGIAEAIFGMPRAAAERGVDRVLSLSEIGVELRSLSFTGVGL